MAAAAGVGIALAGGYAVSGSGPADSSESRSLPGLVACAEIIAVGNVTSASRLGDQFAVKVDAARYLKPENGPAVLSVSGTGAGPARGDRVLVVVHDAAKGDVDLFTGADIDSELAWMEKALPGSRSIDTSGCDGE
ncbi:hypothetical protein ACFQFC_09235 [Amorphoplanes digitatis]|uniref:Uncharacterized protein n=1 Tax=Actinoplanes digitatis TaxID=1868 RepID=A0A7W7MSC3_9ACTN|nr:hypothetical protein [Actinoplanes digitatis]MBB4764374.1 hypothetical protein [Actinoplanes digitatis]GID94139.1 hypothetical protein Adi01nite_35510 [Actinoplanes digitatis]